MLSTRARLRTLRWRGGGQSSVSKSFGKGVAEGGVAECGHFYARSCRVCTHSQPQPQRRSCNKLGSFSHHAFHHVRTCLGSAFQVQRLANPPQRTHHWPTSARSHENLRLASKLGLAKCERHQLSDGEPQPTYSSVLRASGEDRNLALCRVAANPRV